MGEEEATATKAATEPEAEAPAAAAKDAADGEAADAEPKEVVKCDRPNKEEFEAKVQTLESEIHELNDKLAKIDGNITTTKASSGGQMDELQVARDQMKVLRTRKVQRRAARPHPSSPRNTQADPRPSDTARGVVRRFDRCASAKRRRGSARETACARVRSADCVGREDSSSDWLRVMVELAECSM
jgi:hypothetical protein